MRTKHVGVLFVTTALVFGLLMPLTAFSAARAAPTTAKKFTIVFLSQGPTNSWATQMDQIARNTVAKSGEVKKLLYFNAEGNADTQVGQMADAIAEHPDMIVLIPMGAAALVEPVREAEAAHIPVVLCASAIDASDYQALVFHDLKLAGEQNAQWLANEIGGKGTIAWIDGLAGNSTTIQIDSGAMAVFNKYPNIKIDRLGYNSYSIATSKELAETLIASGKKVVGMWGMGGEAVLGFIQAYADAHKTIPPVAGGNVLNGLVRLAYQYHVQIAGWQYPSAISAACFTVALQLLNHQKVTFYANSAHLANFIDISDILPTSTTSDWTTNDVVALYKPQYTDDYIAGSDLYLTQAQLKSMHLLK